ncbi:MAG TPA: BPSS1780 family membrane protein [Burkholderiales bacterium]|nr:BPSS1780 family membrane protein [Burkholderiales bacterium]
MLVVPAGNGWLWLKRGFGFFGRAPLAWIMVAVSYWVLVSVVGILPYVGVVAVMLATPSFAVSFMAMCRELEHGRPLELQLLFAGFRRHLPALVALGGIYFAAILLILVASQLFDGGLLLRWMLLGKAVPRDEASGSALAISAIAAFALFVPVILAFWFAPVLTAWHGMPAAKALFFSFFASLRNWRAFFVYGTAVAVFAGLLPGVAFSMLAVAVRGLQGAAGVISTVALVVVVILLPTLYASFYASYRDVFADQPSD